MASVTNQLSTTYLAISNPSSEESYIDWFDKIDFTEMGKQKMVCALWIACADGNQRLVTHILTKDRNLTEERYYNVPMLLTALAIGKPWENRGRKTWEQARDCAQSLIDAGGDVNAKSGDGDNNLLGQLIWSLKELKECSPTNDEKIKEQINKAAFLIANNARCHLSVIGDLVVAAELMDPNRRGYLIVALCMEYLAEAREEALLCKVRQLWSKMRLIFIGNKSNPSPFSALPKDILNLMCKHVALESLNKV